MCLLPPRIQQPAEMAGRISHGGGGGALAAGAMTDWRRVQYSLGNQRAAGEVQLPQNSGPSSPFYGVERITCDYMHI